MKILKTDETINVRDFEFCDPVKVQGGLKSECGGVLKIESGGRYKLFTETNDLIFVSEGKGFVKWARGEFAFSAGDSFVIDGAGEYELNGKGVFFVKRK